MHPLISVHALAFSRTKHELSLLPRLFFLGLIILAVVGYVEWHLFTKIKNNKKLPKNDCFAPKN